MKPKPVAVGNGPRCLSAANRGLLVLGMHLLGVCTALAWLSPECGLMALKTRFPRLSSTMSIELAISVGRSEETVLRARHDQRLQKANAFLDMDARRNSNITGCVTNRVQYPRGRMP